MAHIISVMNEVLGSGFHGLVMKAEHGSSRRKVVTLQRRTPELTAVTKEAPVKDAEVRMDRVRALQASIADGSYNVSASDLADRLLDTMLSKG